MRLLAIVRAHQLPRIRAALHPTDALICAAGSSGSLPIPQVDIAVVNPGPAAGDGRAEGVAALLPRLIENGTPVVLYVPTTAVRACIRWVRSGAVDVILEGIDDEPALIRKIIVDAQDDVCRTVLCAMEHMLAGLPAPNALVRFIRVVRAYTLMRRPGASCSRVASLLGYSSGRQLSVDMRLVVGKTASGTQRAVMPAEFVRHAISFVQGECNLSPAIRSSAMRSDSVDNRDQLVCTRALVR
jgi:hypothetical protein